jgi:hypothetical protein
VVHACNLSYSGGRDEDPGSKPAWANRSLGPILKICNTERADSVAPGIRPEFKPQDQKKEESILSLPADPPPTHTKLTWLEIYLIGRAYNDHL